jgi:hypothetical protein
MSKAGRPSKLTPEVKAESAAEIAIGIPKTIALEASGMERHAFDRWLKDRQFRAIYGEKGERFWSDGSSASRRHLGKRLRGCWNEC